MAGKVEKTNVMRVLDSRKVSYGSHTYEADPTLSGVDIAGILGEPVERVFKTLVAAGSPGKYYVFVIPVAGELNLKKAAAAAGEKSVRMLPQKELLPLTGYVHGGCSPIGMKKRFPTFLHETAKEMDRIYVSAGKVGWQIDLAPGDLRLLTGLQYADLT
ncbi:MAG: Cys-tRNA(Pro) deacylase [Clostridia bacterium]|nr:Cys-tRNA(Pro) deacylase [Clostridia bacterium]